jgi:hypothetical protein
LFSTEKRIVVVTHRRFRAHFQTLWAPSFKTIHKLYNQFNNDRSLLERKHRWPSSVHSLVDIDAIRVALQRSPGKSTRKAAAQLRTPRRLVQRILKNDVNLYSSKMTVLPKLTVQNKHQRIAFAE